MKTTLLLKLGCLCLIVGSVVYFVGTWNPKAPSERPVGKKSDIEKTQARQDVVSIRKAALHEQRRKAPRSVGLPNLTFWWDGIPQEVRQVSSETGPESNIQASDYTGPKSCQKCHAKNYADWFQHPHRRMNALATEENVLGDFTGTTKIDYLGGEATFFREADGFRMRLSRGGESLLYDVRQTIGSRFFQYYIGRLLAGPTSDKSPLFRINHVLPFGYWLDREEWIPVVHVGHELPDGQRDDPFQLPENPQPGINFLPYASNCNMCHTTFPLADDFVRKPEQIAKHTPVKLHWHLSRYLQQSHPELLGKLGDPLDATNDQMMKLPEPLMDYEADEHAVALGISCESCHLGCKQHSEGKQRKPDFHPHSPFLLAETKNLKSRTGRTHQNVNWACARCHVGERPQFAGGMATWNSTEYSDAMLGSCYSELKCIDCHAPHQATGKTWPRTPQQDDASCIRCHHKFKEAQSVVSHTHHAADSAGSRCMNCHMPRINEGLQSVVRTHTIFSPTNAAMLEANHPNACNQCHVDKPIDWTLKSLKDWYGKSFSERKIAEAYPLRNQPVATGWLKSPNEAVRLIAADSIIRVKNKELLPGLIDMLDDPFLINRQFTQHGVEEMKGIRLDQYGYRFYMSPQERADALKKIREALAE